LKSRRLLPISAQVHAGIVYFPARIAKAPIPVNASFELDSAEVLRIKLEVLRREHRDLDAAIQALEAQMRPDQLMLRRLKKQKLALKDQIARIEDGLIPDIIA
jgi:hypothetical protein